MHFNCSQRRCGFCRSHRPEANPVPSDPKASSAHLDHRHCETGLRRMAVRIRRRQNAIDQRIRLIERILRGRDHCAPSRMVVCEYRRSQPSFPRSDVPRKGRKREVRNESGTHPCLGRQVDVQIPSRASRQVARGKDRSRGYARKAVAPLSNSASSNVSRAISSSCSATRCATRVSSCSGAANSLNCRNPSRAMEIRSSI